MVTSVESRPFAEVAYSHDYYLAHPPQQPKREIAEYAESEGILVPERFSGLEAALVSGKPFLIRSEHPQDYAGASGLMNSMLVTPEAIQDAQARYSGDNVIGSPLWPPTYGQILSILPGIGQDDAEHILTKLSESERKVYCNMTGQEPEAFDADISYSYWEAIDGVNWTVVADSAVADRYHLFSRWTDGTSRTKHYVASPDDVNLQGHNLIDLYEQVRTLSRFDENNCPIIEVQERDSELYFLQYHKGADFQPSSFSLDRMPDDSEIAALLTRGATHPDGEVIQVGWFGFDNGIPSEEVNGAIDATPRASNTEPWVRKRKLQILFVNANELEAEISCNGHTRRSMLVKPQVSVVLDHPAMAKLLAGVEFSASSVPQFPVHVTSDGTKAYLRRI